MTTPANRNRIVAETRRWIGTPYVHQQSARGQGCDCLGLVAGVWRTLAGGAPAGLPAYTSDWGEVSAREYVLESARLLLEPLPVASAESGDLLVFRWRPGAVAKHLGILTASHRFVHAHEGVGVVEAALVSPWRRRVAAAFRFPEFAVS
jgi:NlpC/P60 family putative phage cell wall peptidase